jgi:hypothetical protein
MTTQTLIELRKLAVEADQIGMGWTLHSGDKMNVYSTFPFGDDYHIARFFEDVCAAFSVAANPAKVIELLDALEARDAELAALKAQPVVAWIEHDWSGAGARHLCFERRAPSVRDQVVNPIWTPLCVSAQAQAQPSPVAQEVGSTQQKGDR